MTNKSILDSYIQGVLGIFKKKEIIPKSLKRKILEHGLTSTPMEASEYGTQGYRGTSSQKAIDYWIQKSIKDKLRSLKISEISPKRLNRIPKLEVISKYRLPQNRSKFNVRGASAKTSRSNYLGAPDFVIKLAKEAEKMTQVPAELLIAQMKSESSFNPNAKSSAGAVGVSQFMPATARQYGLRVNAQVDERLDPTKSIPAQARYMRDNYFNNGKNWKRALSAYNSGKPNAYLNPNFRETYNYVNKVMGDWGGKTGIVREKRTPASQGWANYVPSTLTPRQTPTPRKSKHLSPLPDKAPTPKMLSPLSDKAPTPRFSKNNVVSSIIANITSGFKPQKVFKKRTKLITPQAKLVSTYRPKTISSYKSTYKPQTFNYTPAPNYTSARTRKPAYVPPPTRSYTPRRKAPSHTPAPNFSSATRGAVYVPAPAKQKTSMWTNLGRRAGNVARNIFSRFF